LVLIRDFVLQTRELELSGSLRLSSWSIFNLKHLLPSTHIFLCALSQYFLRLRLHCPGISGLFWYRRQVFRQEKLDKPTIAFSTETGGCRHQELHALPTAKKEGQGLHGCEYFNGAVPMG
jgi:hypothetical protein